MSKKWRTIDNNEMMKGHNGFKYVDMNKQKRTEAKNPLTSVFRVKKKDSPLAVKGQMPHKPKDEMADGHLGHGSEPRHKENPHFPLRRPDDDVE